MTDADWRPEPRRPEIIWPAPAQRQTVVAATGVHPYVIDDLRRAAPSDYVWLVQSPLPDQSVDVVVVGAKGYDLVLVMDAIRKGHAQTLVLPQDGFLDLIHFGHDWWAELPAKGWTSKLEQAVQQQDGIRLAKFLVQQWKDLTFKWPETEEGSTARQSPWSSRLNDVSALRERGYQITHKSDEERWGALEHCVRDLGLQQTAYFIAFLIRTRLGYVGEPVIAAWRHDLAKLRAVYHLEALTFYWPEV